MNDTSNRSQGRSAWSTSIALLLVMGIVTGFYLIAQARIRSTVGLSNALVAGACVLSILALLHARREASVWRSLRFLLAGVAAIAAANVWFWWADVQGSVRFGPSANDALFLLAAALFWIPVQIEYAHHFRKDDRREIAADVALISAALGTILYLLVRPEDAGLTPSLSSAVFAFIAATSFSSYGALALWVPSVAHVGQFAAVGAFSSALMAFATQWVRGAYQPGMVTVDLPLALGALGLAAVVTLAPRRAEIEEAARTIAQPTRYGRALLTTVSVAAACTALGLVAGSEIRGEVGSLHASALIWLLGAAVAVRILVNQLRSTQAAQSARDALDQKEIALLETDKALARLQRANETLRESEERLRLVFEAAVDGIVELDDRDLIVRANEAFSQMLELPQSMVEGQPWAALAPVIQADESFATLPQTGQGTLLREGQAIYLEARTSDIPGDPPRRLLLVRDVTAARVADQTIRSLFKFLQDRDEDRTRIMRRTNAAIEGERNRIARDLHDGPVQGVSAASLSLEAVLLMLKAGEMREGIEVLTKVRQELAEEADNLRRLMAGLRPPLLEERGLVPALRENLEKFGHENGIETVFSANGVTDVPQDLETLAYRIVQEALSNAGKHSKADRITVTVEALGGQLRIEVADNGAGFESAKAREFLRLGRVGLASMRERVELANGTFMVHSTPGKGTTVLATLPLESVPAPREFAVNEAF
ncbi:MAG TPA: ATP-binding protein [Actinomycetota bacterium]